MCVHSSVFNTGISCVPILSPSNANMRNRLVYRGEILRIPLIVLCIFTFETNATGVLELRLFIYLLINEKLFIAAFGSTMNQIETLVGE